MLKEDNFNLSAEKDRSKEHKEPWTEHFEVGGNKIEILYTGQNESFESRNDGISNIIWDIDKIEVIPPQGKRFNFYSRLVPGCRFARSEEILSDGSIMIARETSKQIIFSNFIRNKKTYFVPEGETSPLEYCEKRRGRKVFPWGEVEEWEEVETMTQPLAPLMLMHEIGHLRDPFRQKMSSREKGVEKEIEAKIRKIKEAGEPVNYPFTRKEAEQYYKYLVMGERMAWNYALREYRQLKKQGTNILPEGITNRQILEYINIHLTSQLRPIARLSALREIKQEATKQVQMRITQKETVIEKILNGLKKILE